MLRTSAAALAAILAISLRRSGLRHLALSIAPFFPASEKMRDNDSEFGESLIADIFRAEGAIPTSVRTGNDEIISGAHLRIRLL